MILTVSHDAYLAGSQKSMTNTAEKVKQTHEGIDLPIDCTVSLDGSWQKQGFDSQNGIVTAIIRGFDSQNGIVTAIIRGFDSQNGIVTDIIRGNNGIDKCSEFEIMSKKCTIHGFQSTNPFVQLIVFGHLIWYDGI